MLFATSKFTALACEYYPLVQHTHYASYRNRLPRAGLNHIQSFQPRHCQLQMERAKIDITCQEGGIANPRVVLNKTSGLSERVTPDVHLVSLSTDLHSLQKTSTIASLASATVECIRVITLH
jgi:hypothetical protein